MKLFASTLASICVLGAAALTSLNGTIEKLENHVVSMELDDNYFDETETLLDYAE